MKLLLKLLSSPGIRLLAIVGAVITAFNPAARATTYTWINAAGGYWSTNANWAGGAAPINAGGSIVDFSKVGLTNNVTVNVDAAVTIGSIIIGNTNTGIGITPYNWTFTDDGNSGNALTLAGGTSTITITNTGPATNLVTFSTLLLAGTNGATFDCNSSGNIAFSAWNWQEGGQLVNSGTGNGSVTINAGIYNNSGITELIQNSATSPFILSGKNYYNVPTVISNGWLLWNCGYTAIQIGSPITVNNGGTLSGIGWIPNVVTVGAGGTLAPGTNDGYTIGTLILTNDASSLKGGLALSGNLFFKLHKGLSQSNDLVQMVGPNNTLTNLGTGTLTITNVGPALVAGDSFYLFSKPLAGGNNLTIVGGGATFTNNLAVNGSISVSGSGGSPPAPVIQSISPTTGSTAGGTSVTISGTNFFSGDTVKFGSVAGTGVTVNSVTNITVTTPAESAGAVNVTVTDSSSQSSTLTDAFTFTVLLPPAPVAKSLSPTSGTTAGGTSVTISGTNFFSGDTVKFGSVAGTGVTVNSVTNITVTTPAESAGTVNLTVTDTNNQSSILTNGFTYTVIPADVGVTLTGPAAVSSGTNFTYVITVTNSGPASASSVVVTDTLPFNVTFVSASGNGSDISGVVNWALGTLVSGQASNLTLTVTAPTSGTITNIASVGSGTLDTNLANNTSAPVTTAVTNGASSNFGVWVAANGGGDGLWTGDTGNWSNNVVARKLGQTAYFSQGDYTGTQAIHVDAPVTNGYEVFGTTDTGTAVHWAVDNNGNSANTLTLATTSGIPVITVSDPHTLGNSAMVTAVVAGSQGLSLSGGGKLTLGNGTTSNTFSGGITIGNGTLFIETNAYADTADPLTLGSTNAASSATLLLGNTAFPNPIVLTPGAQGTLTISGDPTSAASQGISGPAVNLNGGTLTFVAVTGATGNSYFQNGVTNNGNLILIQNGSGTLNNNGTYGNSGSITLQGTGSGSFSLGTLGTNLTTLSYNSSSAAISGTPTINANNNGTTINSSSALNLNINIGAYGSNLTLNANSAGKILINSFDYRFAGFVANSGTGTGSTVITPGIFNNSGMKAMIQNSATSPLVLSGSSYYNVPTLISNGCLIWNSPLTAGQKCSPITVYNGGILSGNGVVPNLVTIQAGGTLEPGTNDGYTIGTLTITNGGALIGGLLLNGNLMFKLNTSLSQSNDLVKMIGTDTLTNLGAGTLFVTNVGPALVTGQTFHLFNQPLIGGNNLSIVCIGNSFTNNLAVNGSISVTSSGPPPPPPSVMGVSPTSGFTVGGTVVTIAGTNFVSGDTVKFGANAGTNVTVNSSTNITVTTPAGSVGVVNVKVTDTSSQSSTLTNGFTYNLPPAPTITSLTPTNGPTGGGTVVNITGSNFASGDTVAFGANAGISVIVNSSTSITATTPAGSAGAVNVNVTDTSSQSATLNNGFTYTASSGSSGPAIVITNMPAYGTFGPTCFLSGYVTNANFNTNCVVVYEYWPNQNPSPSYDQKLSPWGWFSRPTFANQLIPINPNGSWSCNMPSNLDQYAEEYCVLLVPTNWSQPYANGVDALVNNGININLAEATLFVDRTDTNRRQFSWAGYNWWVKTAGSDGNEFLAPTGPGGNYYSDNTNNVWVDSNGSLHLKITQTNGVWECAQIWNGKYLGYGQYSCTLNANISNLDANVIFSMFTWANDNDYVNREIDIEPSRWDYAFGSNNVEDYAISPYASGQTLRFGLPPWVTNSTHSFTWTSTNSVSFETYNGNYNASPASTNILENWTTSAQPIPPSGGEEVSLILWLDHGNPPLSGQPVEVTLSDFVFTPAASLPGNGPLLKVKSQIIGQPGQPTGIVTTSGKSATVFFAGKQGNSYNVERSTNLLTGWVVVWTTNAPPGGLFNYTDNFTDLGGIPPASAYYRLSW
jgi:Domain of unknown function DUF11/IPT/TIG domain